MINAYGVLTDYVVAANATLEVLSPIVADIKGVLGDALVDINALVGLSEDVVLGLEGGLLLTVTEVAAAIVGLLTVRLGRLVVILVLMAFAGCPRGCWRCPRRCSYRELRLRSCPPHLPRVRAIYFVQGHN